MAGKGRSLKKKDIAELDVEQVAEEPITQTIINEAGENIRIPAEMYHEMRANHYEMQIVSRDIALVAERINSLELQKKTREYELIDTKNKQKVIMSKNQALMERIKQAIGIDIRGRAINPDTFEVMP